MWLNRKLHLTCSSWNNSSEWTNDFVSQSTDLPLWSVDQWCDHKSLHIDGLLRLCGNIWQELALTRKHTRTGSLILQTCAFTTTEIAKTNTGGKTPSDRSCKVWT